MMKKAIKKTLVIAVLFSAMVSYASDFVITNNEKDDVTNIELNNVAEGSVLSIKDVVGVVLYKETIKTRGNYSKKFDLTALPDGNYILELDNDYEIKSMPFMVNLNGVHFAKENESLIFKPTFAIERNILKIQKTNLIDEESLNLDIYFENGDLIYSEKIESKELIHKTYDFSKSVKGKYNVVLSTNEKTFVKEIDL